VNNIQTIYRSWLSGHYPTAQDYETLLTNAIASEPWPHLFDWSIDLALMHHRGGEFISIAPTILQKAATLNLNDENQVLSNLWHLWLPLAQRLQELKSNQTKPLIQGLLGGQGTGKTTLTQMLQVILQSWGYSCLCLSLDDLYLTYRDRELLRQQQPDLIWRGPPGTHDIPLGKRLLAELIKQKPSIAIPRFDKSLHGGAGDRVESELIPAVNIVLFEGWFVGCRPINATLFDTAPAPITTEADRQFARSINQSLQQYLPLWNYLDSLWILKPQDYRWSKLWRWEAEQAMKAQGKSGMDDQQLGQFVDYFWRSLHPQLFIDPLMHQPSRADLIIDLDRHHRPIKIYGPTLSITNAMA
jgi:D-glycerate 3-kinase